MEIGVLVEPPVRNGCRRYISSSGVVDWDSPTGPMNREEMKANA